MGVFSSIFKKKQKEIQVDIQEPKVLDKAVSNKKKGIADPNGLYPSDLVLLSMAHNYKVNETNYPRYLTYDFEIANPYNALKQLESQGFIRRSTAIESLTSLKVAELKEVAGITGVVSKKTKAALVEALSTLDDATLEPYIKDRYWKVTESGQTALNYNRYIEFFLEKHNYSLGEVGIDIWAVNKEVSQNPKARYRDLIWHLLNNKENETSIEIQTKRYSGTAVTMLYCNIYRTMGLFLEEEERYENAANHYFQYLYKWVNIHAGLDFFARYSHSQDKKVRDRAFEWFYESAKLYPYQSEVILRLKNELQVDDDGLYAIMRTGFERSNDVGIFNYEEMADYLMLELAGETDKSKAMCLRLAKKAIKKAGLK